MTLAEQQAGVIKRLQGRVAADQTIERRLARLEEQMREIIVQLIKFEAIDGNTFDTEDECLDWEQNNCWQFRLLGLGKNDIERALDRVDVDLADAIERAGNVIGRKRRESGEFRRTDPRRKPSAEDQAPQISTNPEDRRDPNEQALADRVEEIAREAAE